MTVNQNLIFAFFLSLSFFLSLLRLFYHLDSFKFFCDSSAYLQDFQDVDQQYLETKNSGQFVTAPSSPKQRLFSQPANSTPFSFTFPTPEQQFQAQLMQKLQSLSGYQSLPYSMLPPNVYQTVPTGLYSYFNTYPQMKSCKPPGAAKPGSSADVNSEDVMKTECSLEEDLPPPIRLESPPLSKKAHAESKRPKGRGNPPPEATARKSRMELLPSAGIPCEEALGTSPRLSKSPVRPAKMYQNAFTSALSSFMTLKKSDAVKKPQKGNERPNITRSTSEKVPNRSELMDLVQRTAWARQTK